MQMPQIVGVRLDRAFYRPGETVHVIIRVSGQADRLSAVVRHLVEPVGRLEEKVSLAGGEQTIQLAWTPPPDSPCGYGLDLRLESAAGERLATASTAFDVLAHWTQSPRYGFLSDFSPGRSDVAETMEALVRYHINALQFYDWMYRHEQFLTSEEPYRDPLGRELSRATVERLIAAAHAHGIAAMPYTAVYAASVPFYQAHPDWALRQPDGKPVFFGQDFLVLMDPRAGSAWARHLLDQFEHILRETAFDGIHLDQYGDPKIGYDVHGEAFPLDVALAEFINATRARVDALRSDGTVVFNAVNNWPVEAVAPAAQDLVYIEVWPPHTGFDDLHRLIVEAQALGGGKPVVLAAYIDPALEYNVRLMDAVIFASGGGHIELGERDGMLADPYFPNYGVMSPALAEVMRRYYDFAVRYQEVIGPGVRDVTRGRDESRPRLGRIEIEGVSTDPDRASDKVWPIVREGDGFTAVSLINLLGVASPEWARRLEAPPRALGRSTVRMRVEREVGRLWLATPDRDALLPRLLPFRREREANGDMIRFEFPFLDYWNLVVIEWVE